MPNPMNVIQVMRPVDFDTTEFYYDPNARLMRLAGKSFVAGDVISGDKALMFLPDGTVVHADPTISNYVYLGIALTAAQPGDTVTSQRIGLYSTSYWTWTFGLPIFTAPGGNLTQVPPDGVTGFSQVIGRAVSPTAIELQPEVAISMGAGQ